MKKRILFWFLFAFFVYTGFLYLYLFLFKSGELPAQFIGSAADPATFLGKDRLELVEEYAPIRDFLFFLGFPLEWGIYLLLLFTDIGQRFETWTEKIARSKLIRCLVFTFLVTFCGFILLFPYRYAKYYFSKEYGISQQTFGSWLKEGFIDHLLNWGILFVVALIVIYTMEKYQRTFWFRTWLFLIPLALLAFYLQPVLIEPLYNEVYPLENKELENKIISLASKSGVPTERVFEVNMSDKTNAINAYVTGIGTNSRIVLWDTMLERLDEDEILFITAHEIGHYVEKHIYLGLFGYIIASLLMFYTISAIYRWIVGEFGETLDIRRERSFRSFLMLLLIFSILTFATSPAVNAISRYQEMRADRYAIELTENRDAAVSAFQQLAKAGLSQVNPPVLVKWFRYTHPTMLERIHFVQTYKLNEAGDYGR